MNYTGIWIDKDKAHIVSIVNGAESFSTLFSEIEKFTAKGGSGQRFKSGPQDVIKDGKYLEREKHQFRNYFKTIVSVVNDADELVIFGPADTNQKLNKELENNYSAVASRGRAVVKTDSMTDNQIRAWVRDFFELN